MKQSPTEPGSVVAGNRRPAVVPLVEPIFVSASAAAAMFGVSERRWHQWNSAGVCPAPVRFHPFGRAVRWSVAELRAWAAAGMPNREEWDRRELDRSLD